MYYLNPNKLFCVRSLFKVVSFFLFDTMGFIIVKSMDYKSNLIIVPTKKKKYVKKNNLYINKTPFSLL